MKNAKDWSLSVNGFQFRGPAKGSCYHEKLVKKHGLTGLNQAFVGEIGARIRGGQNYAGFDPGVWPLRCGGTGKNRNKRGHKLESSQIGSGASGVATFAACHPGIRSKPRSGGQGFSGIRHRGQHFGRGGSGGDAPLLKASSTGFIGDSQRSAGCVGAGAAKLT